MYCFAQGWLYLFQVTGRLGALRLPRHRSWYHVLLHAGLTRCGARAAHGVGLPVMQHGKDRESSRLTAPIQVSSEGGRVTSLAGPPFGFPVNQHGKDRESSRLTVPRRVMVPFRCHQKDCE